MSAEQAYYQQEAKNGFADWTDEGLRFLLQYKSVFLSGSQISLIRKNMQSKGKKVETNN